MQKGIVDGSLGLNAQETTLNGYQQKQNVKVVAYKKDSSATSKQNIATCEDQPLGVTIPDLKLREVPNGSTPEDVKPDGTTLTCDDMIYVNSKETHGAVFHGS